MTLMKKLLTPFYTIPLTWAIIFLITLFIIFISIKVEGIEVSGIATLGLLLVAIQALHFTKKQQGEWRKKDAIANCIKIESEFNNIAKKMILFKNAADSLANKNIGNLPTEADQNKIQKITIHLEIINEHLRHLEKTQINPAIELLSVYSISNYYYYAYKDPHLAYEENEEFRESVQEFNKKWVKFEEHALKIKREDIPTKNMEALLYLNNLKLLCISD